MSTRSLTPKESERVRLALRELLMIEKTQTSLAKRLGVSQQALSAVIRGTATADDASRDAIHAPEWLLELQMDRRRDEVKRFFLVS